MRFRPTRTPRAKLKPESQTPGIHAREPHALLPLPFDPKKLRDISERMIVSHHENNYAGAVKNLNKVTEQIAALPADAPGFLVGGLRERELVFRNSAVLHEHYFANLGGDGRIGGGVEKAIATSWTSAARFESEFRATAQSLAGGSGWVVLALDLRSRSLGIWWSGNHSQSTAATCPLLVLDMYEHAFAIDYGAAAAKYVDAFFANANWEAVDHRLENALRASQALTQ